MCEHVGSACICKLARALSRLPHLKRLDLAGNDLGALPDAVGDLRHLQYLDISGNKLKDISVVGNLQSLVELKADDNQIESVDLGSLQNLKKASFVRNRISEIPDFSWDTLASDELSIALDGNPCHPA